MVMVDVFVPSMRENYNFNLDEQVFLKYLIPEIVDAICQKENCFFEGKPESLVLCKTESRQILDRSKSLSRNGVMNGCRLLLL